PVALLLTTVTRSETAAGTSPATTVPKLIVGRSSAIERTGWRPPAPAASWETLALGDGEPEQVSAAVPAFRGAGATAVKSAELTFVSVQPSPARTAARVLERTGAAPH